jgi:PAS domain S-box-containing protein
MANQTFIHLLGYSSFQALARKNLEKDEYFPTYPRKRFKKIMEQEGEIKGLEAWWKRRDGTSVYLRENAKAVRDKKGKIIYYEGTIEDITEYKRALQALQDSEERYRQLVEQSKDAIVLVDINGKVIYASQACQQIFGYAPQEFVSDFSLMERNIHPKYRKKYKRFWKLFLTTGELPQSYQEWAWVHRDGRTVFTQHSFTSIRDEQGKTVGFQTIIRDITEQRLANEQVRILSDMHRLVAEAMVSSKNVSELAQSILNGLDRLIQFDIAEIGVETMGRPGNCIAQIRLPEGFFQHFTERQIQLGDWMGPGIKVLRFNQPILVTNARTDKLTKYAHDLMTEYDVNQIYTVPLNTKGLTTGVLQIYTIGSKTFLKRDLEIVNIVAKEIAAGMEKVMAEETVEREREAFRIIADSSLQRLDLCQLCQRVLEGLVKVLEFDNGNLALYNEQKKELEYGASIGLKENIFGESVSPISVDDDRYISAWVARRREPVFAPDVTKHDIYSSHKQRLQELKVKSLLAYPLIGSNDTLLGVLQLCGEKPRMLFEADRTFFYAVANMLSSAIEHKLAEKALTESEEKYRTLVEQATDGVVIVQDGILIFVNPAMSRMTGFELNELLNSPFMKFIAPDQRDLLMDLYRRRMAGEKIPSVYETMGVRKDGTELPVELNAALIKYQGRPAELVMLRDLSERKRAEEDLKRAFHELEQAHNELKQLDEAKSEFLNMTSHELRTPLTALLGYSEILNSGILGPLSDGQKKATQRIFLNAKQLSQLVDDLLDFNRMEAGYLALEQEPCEIAQIIAEVSENMTAAATEKACTISIDCEKNLPMIVADRKRILQVFYNLIDNAIKFSPNGGNIAIGARFQDKFVKLFVKDEGSGIPEQYQKKIFEKFFQIEMGDRRSSGGLGMGLAICKSIVEAHGGDIWVESNPGRGSTLSFTIPIINS